jgi:hypothetical protein
MNRVSAGILNVSFSVQISASAETHERRVE